MRTFGTTSYTVDALNRTSGQLYIDGTRVTSTWDSASQQITSQDVTGITTYVWDLDSRKIATQYPTGINLTNTLDPVGNRLLLADLFGVTTYTWDIQSRLTGFVNPITQFVEAQSVSITRDPLDRELVRTNGLFGAVISHVYDPAGRETALYNNNAFSAPSFTNYYDPANNRIGVVESSGGAVSFLFDPSYQLTNERRTGTDAFNTTYGYDPLGNRLTQSADGQITTRTFNSANAQVTSTPPSGPITTSSYDPNGNLTLQNTGGTLTTNTWSPENRLLSNDSAAGSESYQYSQDGLRKQITNSSGTSLFTWDEQNMLLSTDTGLTLQTRQTDYPGYWGGLAYQEVGGYTNIPLFDSQGSTRYAFWFQGNMFAQQPFLWDAFGNLKSTPSILTNDLQYVGQYGYYTDDTGLIYVRGRLYDPRNGRWISRDPIGFAGGDVNLYRYVGNNPVNRVDPSGLAPPPNGCKECHVDLLYTKWASGSIVLPAEGSGNDWKAIQTRPRMLFAITICTGCTCTAPSEPKYHFYQWIKEDINVLKPNGDLYQHRPVAWHPDNEGKPGVDAGDATYDTKLWPSTADSPNPTLIAKRQNGCVCEA